MHTHTLLHTHTHTLMGVGKGWNGCCLLVVTGLLSWWRWSFYGYSWDFATHTPLFIDACAHLAPATAFKQQKTQKKTEKDCEGVSVNTPMGDTRVVPLREAHGKLACDSLLQSAARSLSCFSPSLTFFTLPSPPSCHPHLHPLLTHPPKHPFF